MALFRSEQNTKQLKVKNIDLFVCLDRLRKNFKIETNNNLMELSFLASSLIAVRCDNHPFDLGRIYLSFIIDVRNIWKFYVQNDHYALWLI